LIRIKCDLRGTLRARIGRRNTLRQQLHNGLHAQRCSGLFDNPDYDCRLRWKRCAGANRGRCFDGCCFRDGRKSGMLSRRTMSVRDENENDDDCRAREPSPSSKNLARREGESTSTFVYLCATFFNPELSYSGDFCFIFMVLSLD
jgi:hypothetical protein